MNDQAEPGRSFKRGIFDGTARDRRLPDGLRDGHFLPAESSFESLLTQGAELAEIVRWIDIRNEDGGSWLPMFMADEATIMARIVRVAEQRRRAVASSSVLDHQAVARQLADEMEQWDRHLEGSSSPLSDELHEHMVTALARLKADDTLARARSETPVRNAESVRARLENAVYWLAERVPDSLEASLATGQHDPSMALFLAFLKVYRHAQDALNQFHTRHRNFYYRDVLGGEARKAQGETVALTLSAVPGVSSFVIPAGTQMIGGRRVDGSDVIYRTEDHAMVHSAAVSAVATLFFNRDPLVSPEREMAAVSHVTSEMLATADDGQLGNMPPLFGAAGAQHKRSAPRAAQLGWAFASRLLFLSEGERSIDIFIELQWLASADNDVENLRKVTRENAADSRASEDLRTAVAGALKKLVGVSDQISPAWLDRVGGAIADDLASGAILLRQSSEDIARQLLLGAFARGEHPDQLHVVFGRLMSLALITGEHWLTSGLRKTIIDRFARVAQKHPGDGRSLASVEDLLGTGDDSGFVFQSLRRQAFQASLSTTNGWFEGKRLRVQLVAPPGAQAPRLRIRLDLQPDDPPVTGCDEAVHGVGWNTRLPIVRLLLNHSAPIFGWSLFDDVSFREVTMSVSVRGATDLALYNGLGPIDPTKPFNPFGVRPQRGSWFALGSFEAARKPLSRVTVELQWSAPPGGSRGLKDHYSAWPEPLSNTDVTVGIRGLRGGRWRGAESDDRPQPLFETAPGTQRVLSDSDIRIDAGQYLQSIPVDMEQKRFRLDATARAGFLRVELASPAQAFGHGVFPRLFAEAMTVNARRRKPLPVPRDPWTPECEHVAVSYDAHGSINTQATSPRDEWTDKMYHLHPFGVQTIVSPEGVQERSLLPHYAHAGFLFIGIRAARLDDRIDLAFDLETDSGQALISGDAGLRWAALCVSGWKLLAPADVIEDTTDGLITSGVVSLRLPADMCDDAPMLPAGSYWLRVSADRHLHAFPTLRQLYVNGVTAWQTDVRENEQIAPTSWQPAAQIPGLGGIKLVYRQSNPKELESETEFSRRMSERIRHRGRAVSAWDYERLVLEEFPGIYKAKCLPVSRYARQRNPSGGDILIVVVPEVGPEGFRPHERPTVDAATLERVRDYLLERSPPAARIDVRNATYEQVQVRCKVKLAPGRAAGFNLNRLNATLSDYLSPWRRDVGYAPVFGWLIRSEDILSLISQLDYVQYVTDFSMLRISPDVDGGFTVTDTVVTGEKDLPYRDPWSLAVPIVRHFIQTTAGFDDIPPEPTGIGELEVGATQVVPRAMNEAQDSP